MKSGNVCLETAHRSCVPGAAKALPRAGSQTWSFLKVPQVVLVLKAHREGKGLGEQLRLMTMRGQTRMLVMGTPSVGAEFPGLKGS